jgi:hypothetical protein
MMMVMEYLMNQTNCHQGRWMHVKVMSCGKGWNGCCFESANLRVTHDVVAATSKWKVLAWMKALLVLKVVVLTVPSVNATAYSMQPIPSGAVLCKLQDITSP